jgi:hypothetical protein
MKGITMTRTIIIAMVLAFTAPLALAQAEPAKPSPDTAKITQLETNVETLIVQKKDYPTALQQYAAAAKENPQATYYRDQYAVLQRVIKIKKLMAEETNLEKWKSYAQAVRSYYYGKGYYSEALEVDQAAAGKFDTADFAANYLETLLLTGKNDEAAKFVESKKITEKTLRYQTLEAVLQARTGKLESALNTAKTVQIAPKTNSQSCFDLARVYWAAGDKEKSFSNLTTFMEHTAPSEQPVAQILIQKSSEFAPLQGTEELKKVLSTPSKITQSGCTGGSSCGSCSLKDKCASGSK